MTSTPKDDCGDRHIVGTPGCLFIFGAVLPTLWAIWTLLALGLKNSPIYGGDPVHRYPRDVTELWATAAILTITALALITMRLRYTTARGARMVVLITLTSIASLLNWAILLLP